MRYAFIIFAVMLMGQLCYGQNGFNTLPGSDITILLSDSVNVTFDSVINEGFTVIEINNAGPPVVSQMTVYPENTPIFYKITTSAVYTGNITVNITYDDNGMSWDENSINLMHFKDGNWVDITDSQDIASNIIEGQATSLSTFIIATYNPVDYLCGDALSDSLINISDAVWLINYIFVNGNPPVPIEAGDVNCSGDINISDAVYIINYIFTDGPRPCSDCPIEIERIYITDRTLVQWDITHAVYQYGLDPDSFNFGLGGYAFTPIINPDFYMPGDSGYPSPTDSIRVIGAAINGESRAYDRSALLGVETINDQFLSQALLVAY